MKQPPPRDTDLEEAIIVRRVQRRRRAERTTREPRGIGQVGLECRSAREDEGQGRQQSSRGEQAPRPAHESGTVSRAPPPSAVHRDPAEPKPPDSKTALAHTRFPSDNQTRHCYPSYLEYIKCIEEKGEDTPECEKYAKHCRSL